MFTEPFRRAAMSTARLAWEIPGFPAVASEAASSRPRDEYRTILYFEPLVQTGTQGFRV
jgi:hypothetical protein